jgi:integrase
MAVRKLSTGKYQTDVLVNGERRRGNFDTLDEAKTHEAELIIERTGTTKVDRTLTLGDLKARVTALVWSKQKAAAKSGSVADLVVQYFGANKRVADINVKAVNDFKLALTAAGNTGSTINRKLAALSKMLKFAQDEGAIAGKPTIHREAEGKHRDRYLTHEEEDRMLATLRVWGYHAEADLVMFLLDTGCRLGEALALRWSEIQDKRVTFLDTKNGEVRAIPLTLRLRATLILAEGEPTSGLVFPGQDGGRKLQRVWKRLQRHMKLEADPHFVIHILRHTCASRLLQGGADLEYVRRWLGHKDIKMTQRYAHLAPTSLDALTSILERRPEQKPGHMSAVRHLGVVEGGQA